VIGSLVRANASPGSSSDRFRVDRAEPHFGTRQVGHDGDTLAGGPGRLADAGDALGMTGKIAVRKIQSRNVESGADQPIEHFGRLRRRSDRRDDLGLVVGKRHPVTGVSWRKQSR
jgi:hypothetical protein